MNRTVLGRLFAITLLLGLGTIAWVFLQSLSPAADKTSLILRVDLSEIELDSYQIVYWHNSPVVVFRPGQRTEKELVALNGTASPPEIQKGLLPPAFVYFQYSTYLGCGLTSIDRFPTEQAWPHVWHDPCHGGVWDPAGRRLSGTNRENNPLRNLDVPLHRYAGNNRYLELL